MITITFTDPEGRRVTIQRFFPSFEAAVEHLSEMIDIDDDSCSKIEIKRNS